MTAHGFDELQVSVSFRNPQDAWYSISRVPNVVEFETEHGTEARRWTHNDRICAEAKRTGRLICGVHAGFYDLYVPVVNSAGFQGVLVAGPLAKARPTNVEVLDRWQALSGHHGRLSDPGFFQYLSETLSTLTLEGAHWAEFERLMTCFAALVAGSDSARALAEESTALRERLLDARLEERMWSAARSMSSERRTRSWGAPDQARDLKGWGLRRVPENVLVGLLRGRAEETDPVDAFLRRYELQRACARLTRRLGGVICGQVGDRGVALLTDDTGSASRVRAKLIELARRVGLLARRFGYEVHVGIAGRDRAGALASRYSMALAAAEMALSKGVSVIHSDERDPHSTQYLRELRRHLTDSTSTDLGVLSARFEHYAQTVLEHCGYRLEPVRAKLEAGLERLTEPLLATGALDEKSFEELWSALESSVGDEPQLGALVARYRQLVSDIEHAMRRPTHARRTRGTERALSFMREHLSEPLTLDSVARIAGFAPAHFSRIFKQTQGTTFESHLQRLRLERARQLLAGTSLHVQTASAMSGFKNRIYFHYAFRKAFGMTPLEYRNLRSR